MAHSSRDTKPSAAPVGADRDQTSAFDVEKFDPNATYHEAVFNERWRQHRSPEYFAYRKAWDEVPRNKIELDFPIHLDIETTNVCNLKCPMCTRTEMVAKEVFGEVGMMSREDYRSIIDQGVKHGVKSVKLTYLGEPLAHKDIVWQVEYAKKNGVLDVLINTNGTPLSRKMGAVLLKAGVDNVFISFDAVDPGLFAERRVGTTIGKVIDNVYEFVKLRDAGYPHVQIRLSMIMYDDPIWREQFEGIKAMWRNLVDAVGFGYYVEHHQDGRKELPEVSGFWCAQPFQRMFLKYNGNVTICCVDDFDETVVGNWKKEPLHAIWNGAKYKEIRHLHATGQYYQMPMCRKCYSPHSD